LAVQVVQRAVQGTRLRTFRWVGYSPSAKNPTVCARCIERAPVAARLTAQAAPGEVLMDEATYDSVASRHPDAEERELELKGKSAPVRAFAIHVR
jgi:hypothetical protein